MSTLELIMMYVIGPIITIGASVVTYSLGRRKASAEAKSNELDNTEKAIAIWRNLAEDMTHKLQERESLILEMKEQMDRILLQNNELIHQNAILLKQNKQLILKVNALERDIIEFQKKVN